MNTKTKENDMKDFVIYVNGSAAMRVNARTSKEALALFAERHGPWADRPGYRVMAKEFR